VSRKPARSLVALIVAVALAGCALLGTEPSEPQRLQARNAFERGVKHFQDREAGLALAALQEAVALDPTAARYRDTLGLVLLEVRRPDLATAEFRRAVEIDPEFADAHFHLGVALAEAQRWDEAILTYRKALSLPRLTVPHFAQQNLGLALYHLKRYREAEETLRFAISLDPDMEAAHYNLGLLLLALDRKDEARAAFRRARELAPESPFGLAAQERLRDLGEGG
jgi:Tfp pilus assembly protein PilF